MALFFGVSAGYLSNLQKLYITKRRHRQAGLLPYQRLYVSCGLSEKSKGVTRALCRVVANHELYSDKFVISVVNLNQINKATEEDHKYGIDHWARLFKADTWEAIKKMAQENESVSSAAETMFESSQDN